MTEIISSTDQKLKRHAIGMMVGLTIEYLLGMFSNLYVQFPQGKYGRQLWIFAWQQLPIALHIIIGFLLFIGTIFLLIRSIITKDKKWIISSVVTLIALFAAIAGGFIFIPTQTNTYSFVMAIAFLIAFFSLGWGIYSSR